MKKSLKVTLGIIGRHLMENFVGKDIIKEECQKDVNYFKEMYISDIEKKWNLDLSAISGNKLSIKRIDLVIKTDN